MVEAGLPRGLLNFEGAAPGSLRPLADGEPAPEPKPKGK